MDRKQTLSGCVDLAYALAERAKTGRVSCEALLILAKRLEELEQLEDGCHIERWIEVVTDSNGTELERHEIPY
ncbi:MAG: hypothetical protein ACOYJL_03250 [Tractidigestivibacter sp.]|jgi:hypothetical protein|uniref:hypothetical protein n=1 Tax=Tractidigestivibacter sp. TaxID=2847320 RepID=UPI003D8D54B0